jgi:hypothetical protein
VFQQGTFSPDSNHQWMDSIAMAISEILHWAIARLVPRSTEHPRDGTCSDGSSRQPTNGDEYDRRSLYKDSRTLAERTHFNDEREFQPTPLSRRRAPNSKGAKIARLIAREREIVALGATGINRREPRKNCSCPEATVRNPSLRSSEKHSNAGQMTLRVDQIV